MFSSTFCVVCVDNSKMDMTKSNENASEQRKRPGSLREVWQVAPPKRLAKAVVSSEKKHVATKTGV